ncbi:hypothetical protein [Streptomyces sp. S5]|nr:hypothetical protein [Streptomyces sp. S5]
MGLFDESSSMPMATVMLVSALAAVLALVALVRPWAGRREPEPAGR